MGKQSNPANQSEPSLRDAIFRELNCFEVNASEIHDGVTYIDSDEAETLTDSFMALIQADKEAAVREAEIALARKVLGVSNYSIRRKGVTMKHRLDLLNERMNTIIPDTFGIEDELTHPQAGEGEGK